MSEGSDNHTHHLNLHLKENLMSNRAEEWKKIAKDLYSALLRSSGECGESNHAGGMYHESHERCPVIEVRDKAMENYQNKNLQEKQTL